MLIQSLCALTARSAVMGLCCVILHLAHNWYCSKLIKASHYLGILVTLFFKNQHKISLSLTSFLDNWLTHYSLHFPIIFKYPVSQTWKDKLYSQVVAKKGGGGGNGSSLQPGHQDRVQPPNKPSRHRHENMLCELDGVLLKYCLTAHTLFILIQRAREHWGTHTPTCTHAHTQVHAHERVTGPYFRIA